MLLGHPVDVSGAGAGAGAYVTKENSNGTKCTVQCMIVEFKRVMLWFYEVSLACTASRSAPLQFPIGEIP